MGRTGCGVPRVCLARKPREAPARPPFRHYERNARMRQCETEGTAHVQRPKVWPRRVRSQQSPRWSAERRAFPLERKAPAGACGPTSLARRRVPLHPSACRRSAPLVACEGTQQTSEDHCLARTISCVQIRGSCIFRILNEKLVQAASETDSRLCRFVAFRSSPRKRGPRSHKGRFWIPAFAGMSGGESA